MSRLLIVVFAFLVGAVAGDIGASITRTPLSHSGVRVRLSALRCHPIRR